ncbi:hypothetical protein ACIN5143_A3109 [Acinetobacter baumannii OIFC143]|nr:hypothetical protein ACIN5143_A3109 [Acinetobacter baumannii OIFC143]
MHPSFLSTVMTGSQNFGAFCCLCNPHPQQFFLPIHINA